MEKDYEMIEAMERYGGSFVKALSQCFLRADRLNYEILRLSFPAYCKTYQDMAKEKNEQPVKKT